MLSSDEIEAIIPHRYPFLLVDRIVELEEGVRAVGIKAVSANEPQFQGHFPGFKVMPGVLIVEALAQVGAVVLLKIPENHGKVAFLAGLDGFRFRKQVFPGDTLRLEVQLTRMRGPLGKGSARATVADDVVAEGELMFAIGPSSTALGPKSVDRGHVDNGGQS